MIHQRGNCAISITTAENGFIVTIPVRYKPTKRRHRLRVDHGSDPVLDELKEQAEEEPIKPEPFRFQINAGVHVFTDYDGVLKFLNSLKSAEKERPEGAEGEAFIADQYFE